MSSETTVRVPLTIEERAERADVMAGILAEIEALELQAKAKATEFRDLIRDHETRLQEYGRVLREGAEERRQMDLTFPQEQAAKALHDIAVVACICEGGPEAEVKNPSCAVHGVETGPIAAEVGTEVEANYVAHEVNVDAGEEPVVVADFREAKARRVRR